jgi:cyclohexyl-isocyanide hydratase
MPTSTDTTASTPTVHIGVLFYEGCDELDVIGPANLFFALRWARAFADEFSPTAVHLVAESLDHVLSGNRVVLQPTTTYADCPPLDVLVVAGGSGGPENAFGGRHREASYEPTLAFIRSTAGRDDTIVASVCTGTFLLAGAGVLAGHRGNTHWLYRDDLVAIMDKRGEPFTLVPERVVDDGDIVTSGGVTSGIDLALRLIERLFGERTSGLVAMGVERRTPASPEDAFQTAGV